MTQRLIVLGAGTALPDRERDNTFLVWDSPAGSMLIDCGGRAYGQLLRANVDPQRIRGVILTHSHADHIYGLPAFVFHLWLAKYTGTLDVYANPSTLAMARRLCEALELEQNGHMCDVNWQALPEQPDQLVSSTDAYRISTAPVQHSRPTLAVKIEDLQRGRTVVHSSDTKPCRELEDFARGAHTLIHEATVADPDQADGSGHTTPRQAGELALRCNVERLVLIHYSAQYTMPEDQAIAEAQASGFAGEVVPARELQEIVF